jgi:UDP-GlcNAc:undecaprenyl-phosphate/decaprenyl-phosphate GlcNAc-1-phosphate transferase
VFQPEVVYSLFVVFSGSLALLIYALLLKFSSNLGNRNQGNLIRWSTTVKPSVGGIGFFIVFLTSLVFSMLMYPDDIVKPEILGLAGAVTLGFLIGLADDAYNTKPWLKFLGQFFCGIVLTASGLKIHVFDHSLLDSALTICWIVGIMNSLNMLDNMDGITGSVSFVIILGLAGIMSIPSSPSSNPLYFPLLAGGAASILAFLFYNWSPSKMFMGDTGSMFLGVFIGGLSIPIVWNGNAVALNQGLFNQNPHWAFLLIYLFFFIPITDTTTVTINRILSGKSPFVGGRDHTTHHFVYSGFSERQTAIVFALISVVSSISGIIVLFTFSQLNLIHFWSILILLITLSGLIYSLTKRKSNNTSQSS